MTVRLLSVHNSPANLEGVTYPVRTLYASRIPPMWLNFSVSRGMIDDGSTEFWPICSRSCRCSADEDPWLTKQSARAKPIANQTNGPDAAWLCGLNYPSRAWDGVRVCLQCRSISGECWLIASKGLAIFHGWAEIDELTVTAHHQKFKIWNWHECQVCPSAPPPTIAIYNPNGGSISSTGH